MVLNDLRMIPTITTSGPIGRTLSAIRRELVRLQVQKTKDFSANETPRGTFLTVAPPRTITEGQPQGPRYQPFLSEGSTRYFVTPWPYGLVGPLIQIGDRQYRGFALTGGSKRIVATVMLRATAMRNAAVDYDPENLNPETYAILNSIYLIHTEDVSFGTRQTSFDKFTGFPGIYLGGQNWFFPVKLVDVWNEPASRISADDVVQSGDRKIPLEPGEQDNPWYPTEFVKEYEVDVLVGFIHQTGTTGSTSGYVLDGFGSDMVAMPEETEITGGKDFLNDQPYPRWHAEVKLQARVAVPSCDPEETFSKPVEEFGFMLRNRDENGYIPGSEYPGSDEAHPLRNNYQRQSAFMLPLLGAGFGGSGNIVSFRGQTVNNDLREIPSCL